MSILEHGAFVSSQSRLGPYEDKKPVLRARAAQPLLRTYFQTLLAGMALPLSVQVPLNRHLLAEAQLLAEIGMAVRFRGF